MQNIKLRNLSISGIIELMQLSSIVGIKTVKQIGEKGGRRK
jgi:hypothetical protein